MTFEKWLKQKSKHLIMNKTEKVVLLFCYRDALKEGYNLGFKDASIGIVDPELFERKRGIK
jgi:hypothetical protein